MAITIARNISALRAQRQLASASQERSRLFEALSSGLRINRASDDAAGLAIAESLKTDERVLQQAKRNLNDGISLLQVADGALSEINTVITRMAELSEQAASGSISKKQRQALNKEYQALAAEVRRIVQTTEVNGVNLLDGAQSGFNFEQLTDTTGAGVYFASFETSADGRYITYMNNSSGFVEQLDNDTGEVIQIGAATNAFLRSSADGSRVVFSSSNDLVGENASGFNQLYLYDRNSDQLSQVTQALAAEVLGRFTLSADGSTVAFSSHTQYNEDGTSTFVDTDLEVFTMDLDTRVTSDMGVGSLNIGYDSFALSGDGRYLSYVSNSNITGENGDSTSERFLLDTEDPLGTIDQITVGTTANIHSAKVTLDGNVVFISSDALLAPNPSSDLRLYHYNRESELLTQLTGNDETMGGNIGMSHDGRTAYFVSVANYTGENSIAANQVFSVDTVSGEINQLTNYEQVYVGAGVRVSDDGNAYLLLSANDLAGNNPDGNGELFLSQTRGQSTSLDLEAGFGADGAIVVEVANTLSELRGLGGMLLTSQSAALGALENARDNIGRLARARGIIGAGLSRVEVGVRIAGSQAEEFKAAESRIRDLDIARAAAEATRLEIAQQAATSILSQANQLPALALRLLE